MAFRLESEAIDRLLKAPDYRSFTARLIEEKSRHRKFGYADISRVGGFATRSFPRDVVLGQKRLTLVSLPKLIRGLGLSAELADYFKILVELEQPDCRPANMSDAKLSVMKENIRRRILSKQFVQVDRSDKAFELSMIPQIHAALGEVQTGASLQQIIDKTGLPESEITRTLDFMRTGQLIVKRAHRYYPAEQHVTFQGLKSEIFKKHFVKSTEDAIKMSKQFLGSDEKLFLSSSFSVSRKDLPQLKVELRALLHKYIDSAENPAGDKVVNLVASLY